MAHARGARARRRLPLTRRPPTPTPLLLRRRRRATRADHGAGPAAAKGRKAAGGLELTHASCEGSRVETIGCSLRVAARTRTPLPNPGLKYRSRALRADSWHCKLKAPGEWGKRKVACAGREVFYTSWFIFCDTFTRQLKKKRIEKCHFFYTLYITPR